MISFLNPSPKRAVLIIDINSGSVGAGLVGQRENKDHSLLFATRRNFSSGKGGMIDALRKTLKNVFVNGLPHLESNNLPSGLDRSVVVLGAPWSSSRHTKHELSSGVAFPFGDEQARVFLREQEKEHKQLFSDESNHELFENELVSLNINGYDLSAPITHQSTRAVGAGVVSSAANSRLLRQIESEVSNVFGLERGVHIRSFPFVSSKYGQNDSRSSVRRLVVSFSGDHTEVVEFEGGNVKGHHVFEFGPHTIVSEISSNLDMPHKVAHSHLKLFSQNALDEKRSKEIKNLVSDLEYKWNEEWKGRGPIAEEVYLVSDPEEEIFAHSFISTIMPKARIMVVGGDHSKQVHIKDHSLGILSSISHKLFD
jgi:hypothetical protein